VDGAVGRLTATGFGEIPFAPGLSARADPPDDRGAF